MELIFICFCLVVKAFASPDKMRGCWSPLEIFHLESKRFQIRQKCSLGDIRKRANSEM